MSQPPNLASKSTSHLLQALERKDMDSVEWLPVDFVATGCSVRLCATMARPLSGLSLVNGDDSLLLCHWHAMQINSLKNTVKACESMWMDVSPFNLTSLGLILLWLSFSLLHNHSCIEIMEIDIYYISCLRYAKLTVTGEKSMYSCHVTLPSPLSLSWYTVNESRQLSTDT